MHKAIFLCLFLIYGICAECQSLSGFSLLSGNKLNPLIVGHRGGFDTILPENSFALFEFTAQKACSSPVSIEFDIRESASGSLYIMHDETLDRNTSGSGKITGLQDTYIESLFLKDRNGRLTSEKIPRFSDVLRHFQNRNVILMLDVKGEILPKVIEQIKSLQMEHQCILLTFTAGSCREAGRLSDNLWISSLVRNREEWESLSEFNIPPSRLIAYITKDTPDEVITEINKKGVLLMADMSESIRNNSTFYEPDYYLRLPETRKLSIIITDYPVHVNKLFCN